MQTLFRLLSYIKGYQYRIALAILYSILNIIFDATPEIILGFAIDTVIYKQDSFLASWGIVNPYYQLVLLGSITILFYVLESLFEYLYSIEWKTLAQIIQHRLRVDVYQHIQDLDIGFFQEQSTGVLLNILVDDINLLEQFFNQGASDIIHLVFGSTIISLIFLYVSPIITLLSILPLFLIFYIAFYFKDHLNACYFYTRQAAGNLAHVLSNNLLGITTIKNYTTEKHELDRVQEKSNTYMEAQSHAIYLSSLFIPIVRMAILVGYVVTLTLGGVYALNGTIPIGAYSTIIFLTQRLLWPFTKIASIVDNYQKTMASANRVLKLFSTKKSIMSGRKKLELSLIQGEISFNNVSFSYPNRLKILDDISFTILPKQTVAFVGPTGSGKTTITKLLLRYYDVDQGSIDLDKTNIEELDIYNLRNAFGVVSQDVFLVDGTIEDNIRYGSFDALYDDIVKAAKMAESYDFIMKLPQQFKTHIGTQGQKLSGGQKQRISIARALLKDPPIFIFDEATSAVDNETERAIQHSLQKVSADRTTIIIAHRLSTIRNADIIYVLEDGKITESGTHDDLIANDNFYAYLWRLQTGNQI